MNSDFQQAFKNIRQSVVGIGYRDNSGFHFVGTGFVFDSSGWIMTNRHVLEVLVKREDDKLKLRFGDAVVFLFAQTKLEDSHFKNAGIRAVPIREFDLQKEEEKKVQRSFPIIPGFEAGNILQPETADIGLCKINLKECPADALPLKPVTVIDSAGVCEGTPVAYLGFPGGLQVPSRSQSSSTSGIQITPLLQTGVIAGILPFSGLPKPDAFVLDTYVTGGSSGSPLFNTDGHVIGAVYATRQQFHPLTVFDNSGNCVETPNVGVLLPNSLGLAVPSSKFPKQISSSKE
jgi:S1-C subfamily serine protease